MSSRRNKRMEKGRVIRLKDDTAAVDRECDKNEDDSILGSDELRFSSQDNLLDSSQDGDNQCDVKWDYTSPQTMRQLRKMRGKYCADDVKKIIAKFPDLPVISSESTFKNIQIMLPPKNASAVIERNKQLKAKQRETKILRQRQRCKKAAEDMILFLQQQQHKQEKEKTTDILNKLAASTSEELCDTKEEKLNSDNDAWSDDDLFLDNSFLIEATQNPEKFFNLDKKETTTSVKESECKSGCSNSYRTSNINKICGISTSTKNTCALNTGPNCLSESVIPSSIPVGSSTSTSSNFYNNFVSVNKPSNHSSYAKPGLSLVHAQNKLFNKCSKDTQNTRGSLQKPVSCVSSQVNKKTSPAVSSFSSSNKIQSASMKSPFRKSLSFDNTVKNRAYGNKLPTTMSNQPTRNVHTVAFNSKAKGCATYVQSGITASAMNDEDDLFDSSLSDDLLLQATLSQEQAMACGGSQPLPTIDLKDKKQTLPRPTYPFVPSSKTTVQAPSSLMKGHGKDSNCGDNITNLLLSPVRCTKKDFQSRSKVVSSNNPFLPFNKKDMMSEKSASPAQRLLKHKSSQGLRSSTPVKCLRAQQNECSDSFLEKAFEDSFMNDEALFESQILPMLELAESQIQKMPSNEKATISRTTTANHVHSPVKCSQEEIEVKRQTAIMKRSLRLAQMNHRKS